MNQEKAREMAKAIIREAMKDIYSYARAGARDGVVPDLDRLTKAIQTYAAARYVTHPAVRTNPVVQTKWRDACDYTRVIVEWQDEEWHMLIYRDSTYSDLPLFENVTPPPDRDYLLRRDGRIELVKKDILLRRDPASGVYLPEGYNPPQEIIQATTAGPFRVELHQTVISLHPSEFPMILHYGDLNEQVELRYKQRQAQIALGSGELLAYLAMWQMMK